MSDVLQEGVGEIRRLGAPAANARVIETVLPSASVAPL